MCNQVFIWLSTQNKERKMGLHLALECRAPWCRNRHDVLQHGDVQMQAYDLITKKSPKKKEKSKDLIFGFTRVNLLSP
jgi:hypothetical protein